MANLVPVCTQLCDFLVLSFKLIFADSLCLILSYMSGLME